MIYYAATYLRITFPDMYLTTNPRMFVMGELADMPYKDCDCALHIVNAKLNKTMTVTPSCLEI